MRKRLYQLNDNRKLTTEMKKIIIITSMLLPMAIQAQILNVNSIKQLPITGDDNRANQAVAISSQGDYLLLTTDARQGLVKWDIATSQSTVLATESVNGSEVSISDDGSQVTYEKVSYQGKRRHQEVQSIDLKTGERKAVASASRQRQAPARLADASSSDRPVLSHHHLKLYITRDGVTRQLAPNGEEERYIWSSLSPDGSKVLYYVSGWGAYVCDIDGNNVISMGNITAPRWWDDSTIVGMRETDDEYTITASLIVARTLDGNEQTLTGNDVIATYPLPCKQSGKIAFSTPDGSIYVIDVTSE